MFSEVGKELKTWAKIVTIVLTIPAVILAIAVYVVLTMMFDMGHIGFLIGAFLVFLGYFFARLVCIGLYAFGELVDKVTSMEAYVCGKSKGNKKGRQSDEEIVNPTVKRNGDASWDCPFCEYHNKASAQWCEGCHIKVDFE